MTKEQWKSDFQVCILLAKCSCSIKLRDMQGNINSHEEIKVKETSHKQYDSIIVFLQLYSQI